MSKKNILFIFSTFFSFFLFTLYVHAAASYTALAPIQTPNGTEVGTGSNSNLGAYFSQMYQVAVGVATALAVLMVIWGGVEYVTTDAIGGKEEGKEKVQNAVLGLILALGSYLILQTINPALLNTNLEIQQIQTTGTNYTNQFSGGDSTGAGYQPGGVVTNNNASLTNDGSQYNAWRDWTPQNEADLQSAANNKLGSVDPMSLDMTDPSTMQDYNLTQAEADAIMKAQAYTADQNRINAILDNGGTIPPINASGGGGAGNGTIAQNALNMASFPASSGVTNQQVLDMINNSGILNLSPNDAAKYFPGGVVTAQGYQSLLASIANSESGFNPNDNTTQHRIDGNSSFSSEGLFSLSVGDSAVKALAQQYGISAQDVINNPVYNTQAAINILKNQIQNQGTITGGANTGYWGPLRRGE